MWFSDVAHYESTPELELDTSTIMGPCPERRGNGFTGLESWSVEEVIISASDSDSDSEEVSEEDELEEVESEEADVDDCFPLRSSNTPRPRF